MTNATLVSKVSGVAKGITNAIKGGLAPDDTIKQRLDTCSTCEHYTGTNCKLCGCYMKIKTRIALEKCPVEKW